MGLSDLLYRVLLAGEVPRGSVELLVVPLVGNRKNGFPDSVVGEREERFGEERGPAPVVELVVEKVSMLKAAGLDDEVMCCRYGCWDEVKGTQVDSARS